MNAKITERILREVAIIPILLCLRLRRLRQENATEEF